MFRPHPGFFFPFFIDGSLFAERVHHVLEDVSHGPAVVLVVVVFFLHSMTLPRVESESGPTGCVFLFFVLCVLVFTTYHNARQEKTISYICKLNQCPVIMCT